MSIAREPDVCCVLCGIEVALYDGRELRDAHEAWGTWAAQKSNKKKRLIVPASEVEQLDLETDLPMWSCFYRAILDDPKRGRLWLSGISPHIMVDVKKKHRPAPIMTDPNKAVVFPGYLTARPKWTVNFHVANLFETDWNRENGELVGYIMHPHCWLLVDRFLGHDIVKQDLRAFVQAIETYWRADRTLWMPDLLHYTHDFPCYKNAAPWIRQNCPPCPEMPMNRTHVSSSPLIIRDIQRLIARATAEHEKSHGDAAKLRSTVADVPAEIILIIIDTIWQSSPPCHGRIQDVRSVMEAFQWSLRDSYWQNRCSPDLVFEVQDLIKAGTQIDWACFCLGLHELLLQEDWYCNSGLYFRGRILNIVECIRYSLSNI
ncbi:hypothetical protein BJX96DRAFT_182227 [Aspergillus floccosus]